MSNSSESAAAVSGQYLVYIGGYGGGIHTFRFDPASGSVEPLEEVGKAMNPSWLTSDSKFQHLFAVSELDGKEGGVASFAIDHKTGKLRALNQVPSGGEAPCHASVDESGLALVVANYSSGTVSAFSIKPDGTLSAHRSVEKASGSSVNEKRQEGPHAHEAVLTKDGRVYVPDLGLDRIRIYHLDAAAAKLTPNDPPAVSGEAGFGPRHMVFDTKEEYAYVVNELKPRVVVYRRDQQNGNLERVQTVDTLPADFHGENSGAEIRLGHSGKFVYTSNRGHDSIQVFAIDGAKGTLTRVQIMKTGGQEPRGFAVDPSGKYLFVANQKSNNLVVFKVNAETGKLSETDKRFEVPSPADVYFVPAQ